MKDSQFQELKQLLFDIKMLLINQYKEPVEYTWYGTYSSIPCDHIGAYYTTAGWYCPKCGDTQPYIITDYNAAGD